MQTPQAPIASPFGASSTADDVLRGVDLHGKNVLVTGGYAGLGLETVRALAQVGARVIVPARDRGRAAENLQGISGVELETLDLLAESSIDALAQRFLASGRPLHLLINNAGIMATPLTRDARGYESQFATNHLGHFQLTLRLWPALAAAKGARVVTLSSVGHRRGGIHFEDWNFEKHPYDRWEAYAQSKTANALFALELDRRGEAAGVRSFSVHPGGIITDLARHMSREELVALGALDAEGRPIIDPASNRKTPQMGAATSVFCAASPLLEGLGGVYCQDCNIAEAVGPDFPGMSGVRPWARDPEAAARLWGLSERLTGVHGP